MFRLLDHTVFAFTQHFVTLVEVEQISVANDLFNCVNPPDFLLTLVEVVNAELIRKDQHEGIDDCTVVIQLIGLILDVDAGERSHFLVLRVALGSVTVKFTTQ